MSKPYIQIGSGRVFFNPSTTSGNPATNPTPIQGLTVQDVSLDISGTIESLKGQYQFPDDTAVTDKKCSGKIGIGRKDLFMINQVFSGDISIAGGVTVVPVEAHTIPAVSGPYTVVVTPPGSGTFSEDLGVVYAANSGIQFQRVASGPTVGQYTVSSGTYTFAAADASAAILISYSYTLASQGFTYEVNNQVIGYGPQVEMFIVDTYQPYIVGGVYYFNTIRVYACKFNKISLGNKRDKYSLPELDFEAFASPSGRVLDLYSAQ